LATSQPSGRPSLSLSALFMLVPCDCSSALVKPSPSQSAPPSDGSSGLEPSAEATPAPSASIKATTRVRMMFILLFSSLRFVLFMMLHLL